MSYCRWSSNDFGCDLYVYEGEDGFAIHVASNRVVGNVPSVDWSSAEKLHETYKAQMEFLDSANREPIGLQYDGESFYGLDHENAVDTLLVLEAAGYIFPGHIITDIKEEQE